MPRVVAGTFTKVKYLKYVLDSVFCVTSFTYGIHVVYLASFNQIATPYSYVFLYKRFALGPPVA